jgi:hypothetical protein
MGSSLKFIPGTSYGSKYLVFARNGNVALGIKIETIASGDMVGVPGTTYFMARVRAAHAKDLFAEEDAEKTVVGFHKNFDKPGEAWPNIEWEKSSGERASVAIGVLEQGSFNGTAEQREQLLAGIQGHQLATKIAEYAIGLAGEDNLVIEKGDFVEFIDNFYGPVVEKILTSIQKKAEAQQAIASTVGSVAMHTAILKKVYETTANTDVDDEIDHEDEADKDDSEGDGEDSETSDNELVTASGEDAEGQKQDENEDLHV